MAKSTREAPAQRGGFLHICMICGAEVETIDREPQPHTCTTEESQA